MTMSRSDKLLDKLLATQDAELCGMVFDRIIKRHGINANVSDLTKEEQVVDLVMSAYGIIGNGGFQYLFEWTFEGDPHFAKTVAAFEAIGALECAQALRDELSIFPNSKPPRDIDRRLRIYDEKTGAKVPLKIRMRIGNKDSAIHPIDRFFNQSRDIEKLLARYIWQNRSALASCFGD
jgi:hypothetical protein